jgi:thioredoxin 2
MTETTMVVCPHCEAANRVPSARLGERPTCGKCKKPLFPGGPVVLDENNFDKQVTRSDIPVVVDFWAPWCGPCTMMAPAFEQAARDLEPGVRLAKLNTEESQAVAARYNIRSIPTLILFRDGQEVLRHSGAMSASDIVNWVKSGIGNA